MTYSACMLACRYLARRIAAALEDAVQAGVLPAPLQELLVAPHLDDAAAGEDHDAIRVADGGEPVRDDERRARAARRAEAHEPLQGPLHLALALGVERAR